MRPQKLHSSPERNREHLDEIVRRAIKLIMSMIATRKPVVKAHFFEGSSAIHSRQLVILYVFRSDADLGAARKNRLVGDIEKITREALVAGCYPPAGADQMVIVFTSNEEILRESSTVPK